MIKMEDWRSPLWPESILLGLYWRCCYVVGLPPEPPHQDLFGLSDFVFRELQGTMGVAGRKNDWG